MKSKYGQIEIEGTPAETFLSDKTRKSLKDKYFNTYIKDVIKDLKKKGISYCYNEDQLDAILDIMKTPPGVHYTRNEGLYIIIKN